MQVFQKEDSILGGIDEALRSSRRAPGTLRTAGDSRLDNLVVHALKEETGSRRARR